MRGRPAVRGKRTYGGRPGQRMEEQGTWASRTQNHSEAGYGRPVDRGAWTAKPVKQPQQQPAHPQYANYWAPLTHRRHSMPHSAQPQHTKYWAPRTRKRHQQEHRPQRLTESSNPTQHAKGRTGDCPGPVKEQQPDGMSHRGAQHRQAPEDRTVGPTYTHEATRTGPTAEQATTTRRTLRREERVASFVVAASHAHSLPSPPFWFPVPAILVASPALLCPSSLSVVLAFVPPGVAPAFCVSVLLLPVSVGAPGCPFRAPTPAPPACPPPPPVRGFHISVRRGLSCARLAGHGPVASPVASTSRRAGRSPRHCGVRGHFVEGGGEVFADGSLGVRRIWWLLQCSHLMVPLCIPCVVCPVGARLTAVCGAALCPVALLLAFLPISGSFFFCWHVHRCWCVAPGG